MNEEEEGIILKNINLEGITVLEQIQKLREEDKEFMDALIERDKEHVIEEFWDKVQVALGLMERTMQIKAEEVMKEYPKHLEKIKNRPRRK